MSEENTAELVSYEIMAIIEPDVTEAQYKKHVDALKALLKKSGAEITHEQEWGKRDFAYPIKKQDNGFYVVLNFQGVPSEIVELENQLRIPPFVLRHLIIKTPADYVPLEYDWDAELEEEVVKEEKKPVKKPAPVVVKAKEEEAPVEEKEEVKEEPAEEVVEEAAPVEEEAPAEEKEEAKEEVKEEPAEEVVEEEKPAKEEAPAKKEKEEVITDKASSERLSKLDEKLEELLSSDNDLNL